MATFIPKGKNGPVTIKAANSNTISDAYRDSLVISYQFVGSTVPTIEFKLGDRTLPTPIMAGPVGGYDKREPDGTMGAVRAVAEAGSVYWSGYHHKEEWAKILEEGLPAIRVIKPLRNIDDMIKEITFDTEHGAVGYAMDIDHGLTVYGDLDAQEEEFGPKTVDDLKRLNDASPLPFYVKGIMSVHDAVKIAEAGVTGIVISGHNNRFPCAVPPLKILPEIRKAVGSDLQILVDGGMNTGYDAFKALALGADGVLCARALVGAYIKDGAEGLTQKILEMTAELKGAMANTGSPDLQHINSDSVMKL
jgi:isopentenyl diphosphate isomerase/L-lactate dehydrogenase-like FMN-dependent dehydrogenase